MNWHLIKGWARLPGVHAKAPDPYLIWAQLTSWADLRPVDAAVGAASFDDLRVSLLIELTSAKELGRFRADFAKLTAGGFGSIPAVYRRSRFLTASVSLGCLAALVETAGPTGSCIRRFDISLPVVPGRPAPLPAQAGRPRRALAAKLDGEVLMGVVDTGCPFAHSSLERRGARIASTRIAALWDMNRQAPMFTDAKRSTTPARMGYGAEVLRDGDDGLDAWAASFAGPGAPLDEAACYAAANYRALLPHESHGAHVLDTLAGPVALANRISRDPDTPPDWASRVEHDAASNPGLTDIVFVQLPADALQDSSGSWLGSHMLDAVSYLVSCAGAQTKQVVVSISYGCTVGPHDGSSILEQALDEIIAEPPSKAPSVDIVLAGGNSFDAAGHAVLRPEHLRGGRAALPLWRVLPSSESPSFLQLWFPAGVKLADVAVHITPPDVPAFELPVGRVAVYPSQSEPAITAVFLNRCSRGADSAMFLLAIGPTASIDGSRSVAPHGDWRIEVVGAHLAKGQEIHAYIARNDREMATLLRGRQSYFVDANEPLRYLRRSRDDPGMGRDPTDAGDPVRSRALVRRRGTMNGISTGQRTMAVAGYEKRSHEHAGYSSAGLAGSTRGAGPESACVTDESMALQGTRAAGNVGTSSFRLVGTSTAAPQRARARVNELADTGRQPERGETTKPMPTGGGPAVVDPENASDLWGKGKRPPTLG